jgi:hypothetical protein
MLNKCCSVIVDVAAAAAIGATVCDVAALSYSS